MGNLSEFVIRNKVHLALCSLAAVWAWSSLAAYDVLPVDYLVPSLVVMVVYHFNRLTDIEEDRINCGEEAGLAQKYSAYIMTICVVGALVILCALFLAAGDLRAEVLVVAILLLAFLYSKKGVLGAGRLKESPFFKTLCVALGWTVTTVLYPALHSGSDWDIRLAAAFFYMLSSSMIIELMWDIRDMTGDARCAIRSMPVVLGAAATRGIIWSINGVSALLVLAAVVSGWLPVAWLLVLGNNIFYAVLMLALRRDVFARRTLSNYVILVEAVFLVVLGLFCKFLSA